DTHTVQSNKESGDGRYDVMLIPKNTQQLGLIMEFKVAEEGDTLDAAAEQALKQISDCSYETELRQRNIQKILKIGLAFKGKEVAMRSIDSE
ncbi:MAG TPA: PD-(D/E)XK nuclease domain-containing protein, partial [Gammaproteobacteria bacterium]|nr:PD-(D/E)XK nuclease domain-containing protein [Gammaproteobacteria bacterium]